MQTLKVMILSFLFIFFLVLICLIICILLSLFISLYKLVSEDAPAKQTFKRTFFKLVTFMCDPLKNL
ncbi:hypothetical protein YS9_0826 [Enterococcus sp. C1]|jgi:hypothetical protein|nr:hypothetical protein YS9_0826 [Enterococcus sp. C1]